jgi:hypothetical protein
MSTKTVYYQDRQNRDRAWRLNGAQDRRGRKSNLILSPEYVRDADLSSGAYFHSIGASFEPVAWGTLYTLEVPS